MADVKMPIMVSPSAIQDAIVTGLRYLATVMGGVAAVLGFLGHRDLAGLTAYFQSADGLAFIGAFVAIGSGLYGAYRAYVNKQNIVDVITDERTTVPPEVAQVKS